MSILGQLCLKWQYEQANDRISPRCWFWAIVAHDVTIAGIEWERVAAWGGFLQNEREKPLLHLTAGVY